MTLGCLALLMLQHLTGGRWALVIRRILEAGTRTLPLMAVAALPILAGMKSLYVWARPGQTDPVIVAKHAYLNPGIFCCAHGFLFRLSGSRSRYFLNKWSREEDRGGSLPLWMRLEGLSGGRLGALWIHGQFCQRGLGDVARAPLVFHDLRPVAYDRR